MSKRQWKDREARRTSLLPVHIHGRDMSGKSIRQVACTLNISPKGARLVGLNQRLKIGSTVKLQFHQESGQFQVVWIERQGTKPQWDAGLRCLELESRFWMMELSSRINPENVRQLLKGTLADFAHLRAQAG